MEVGWGRYKEWYLEVGWGHYRECYPVGSVIYMWVLVAMATCI
jgi:hypothetical protein